jgi:hypothetical protein
VTATTERSLRYGGMLPDPYHLERPGFALDDKPRGRKAKHLRAVMAPVGEHDMSSNLAPPA